MSTKDYYATLGVSVDATPAQVQRAYRTLAMRHHPDRVGPEGTDHFQQISEAYEVLRDPRRRASYNAKGRHHVPVRVKASARWNSAPVEPLDPAAGTGCAEAPFPPDEVDSWFTLQSIVALFEGQTLLRSRFDREVRLRSIRSAHHPAAHIDIGELIRRR